MTTRRSRRYESSKEILVELMGPAHVHVYEEVKRMSMRIGEALPAALLGRVGGRVARRGEGCDGITALGKWEFCSQRLTKNSHADTADRLRCPGMCVQVLGRPNPGWVSGREFLERHGVDPDEFDDVIARAVDGLGSYQQQMRLVV